MKNYKWVMAVFFSLFAIFQVWANTENATIQMNQGKRLIQYSENMASWMTPKEISILSEKIHKEGRCGGFFDITDDPMGYPPLQMNDGIYINRVPKEQIWVNRAMGDISHSELQNTVSHLSTQFTGRYHNSQTGIDAAKWLRSHWSMLSMGRSDTKIELYNHPSSVTNQPSVIAEIVGSGPLADEIVILGGHLDSIGGWSNQKLAPGADDNASGIAVVTEIFRVLAQSGYKPNRTIQFMGYAAEEVGLKGSKDIANAYRKANRKVVGVMQFDMTMVPAEGKKITLFTDFTNDEITDFLKVLIDEYLKIPWDTSRCGYGCSDHASWHRAGYPAAMPSEAPFKSEYFRGRIHTTKDTFSTLDIDHGYEFARLGTAFAIELGAGD